MALNLMAVSDFRKQTGKVIRRLKAKKEAIYITLHGRPQAVLVDYEVYEALLAQSKSSPNPEAIRAELENDSDYQALLADIRAAPPNPAAVHPASVPLVELLQNAPPPDPAFDLETWTAQWEAIEAEMKVRDHADDIAEGRG